MNDKKLLKWLALLIAAPLALAIFGGDRFRYPCQDPENWDKDICQKPLCEITQSCPDNIFVPEKGKTSVPVTPIKQGANCK